MGRASRAPSRGLRGRVTWTSSARGRVAAVRAGGAIMGRTCEGVVNEGCGSARRIGEGGDGRQQKVRPSPAPPEPLLRGPALETNTPSGNGEPCLHHPEHFIGIVGEVAL